VLLLAAAIRIAASDARFAQLEIRREIYPFGGAAVRLPRDAGWGDAMRWLLTGEEYDAALVRRAMRGQVRRAMTRVPEEIV
jgi:enoyl-CoA hydratase/carnithine racemase